MWTGRMCGRDVGAILLVLWCVMTGRAVRRGRAAAESSGLVGGVFIAFVFVVLSC